MKDGKIFTAKVTPLCHKTGITLGDIMEQGEVDKKYFIPEDRLYYTSPEINHSDETEKKLSDKAHRTWQYVKGAKKLKRTAVNGHEYVYTEGAVPMIDEPDKPARTLLTSEGSFSRTTHIVRDKQTGEIRLLTAEETEKIQGFPVNHTKYYLQDGKVKEMPVNKRRFMMGNALVVNLIQDMERKLSDIIDKE